MRHYKPLLIRNRSRILITIQKAIILRKKVPWKNILNFTKWVKIYINRIHTIYKIVILSSYGGTFKTYICIFLYWTKYEKNILVKNIMQISYIYHKYCLFFNIFSFCLCVHNLSGQINWNWMKNLSVIVSHIHLELLKWLSLISLLTYLKLRFV